MYDSETEYLLTKNIIAYIRVYEFWSAFTLSSRLQPKHLREIRFQRFSPDRIETIYKTAAKIRIADFTWE